MAESVPSIESRARMRTDYTAPEAWARTRCRLSEATGLDPALYTDAEVHDLELDRVFGRAWVCVGVAAEATEPGTVLVRQVGRLSVLVTVDADAQLHGHLNTCRHRGTELAESDCQVRGTLRCPYHRWGYGMDGALVSTPKFDRTTKPDFDAEQMGLLPVRVGRACGLLFACLDPTTPHLEAWLGDLPDRLGGYGLDSWVAADALDVGIDANWKLISENFQEYYHLPWVHPDLATVSRVEDHYRYQGPGMYCGQTTTPVSDGDGSTWLSLPPKPDLDPSDAVSGRHIAIFPNVVLSILPNHAFVMRLQPVGPGVTRETCSWLLPNPVGSDADRLAGFETLRRFWIEVNGEDIDIVQRSQRGLTTAAGAVHSGPLVPRFEEPLQRFHSMLADHLTNDPAQLSDVPIDIPGGDPPGVDDAIGGRPNPHPPAIDRTRRPIPDPTDREDT